MNATQQRQPERHESERDGIASWRRSQLERTGFPELLAAQAAYDDRYDLHELIELVDSGCPPELAIRILAPLEEDEVAELSVNS
jgi:hypothetical protein